MGGDLPMVAAAHEDQFEAWGRVLFVNKHQELGNQPLFRTYVDLANMLLADELYETSKIRDQVVTQLQELAKGYPVVANGLVDAVSRAIAKKFADNPAFLIKLANTVSRLPLPAYRKFKRPDGFLVKGIKASIAPLLTLTPAST